MVFISVHLEQVQVVNHAHLDVLIAHLKILWKFVGHAIHKMDIHLILGVTVNMALKLVHLVVTAHVFLELLNKLQQLVQYDA